MTADDDVGGEMTKNEHQIAEPKNTTDVGDDNGDDWFANDNNNDQKVTKQSNPPGFKDDRNSNSNNNNANAADDDGDWFSDVPEIKNNQDSFRGGNSDRFNNGGGRNNNFNGPKRDFHGSRNFDRNQQHGQGRGGNFNNNRKPYNNNNNQGGDSWFSDINAGRGDNQSSNRNSGHNSDRFQPRNNRDFNNRNNNYPPKGSGPNRNFDNSRHGGRGNGFGNDDRGSFNRRQDSRNDSWNKPSNNSSNNATQDDIWGDDDASAPAPAKNENLWGAQSENKNFESKSNDIWGDEGDGSATKESPQFNEPKPDIARQKNDAADGNHDDGDWFSDSKPSAQPQPARDTNVAPNSNPQQDDGDDDWFKDDDQGSSKKARKFDDQPRGNSFDGRRNDNRFNRGPPRNFDRNDRNDRFDGGKNFERRNNDDRFNNDRDNRFNKNRGNQFDYDRRNSDFNNNGRGSRFDNRGPRDFNQNRFPRHGNNDNSFDRGSRERQDFNRNTNTSFNRDSRPSGNRSFNNDQNSNPYSSHENWGESTMDPNANQSFKMSNPNDPIKASAAPLPTTAQSPPKDAPKPHNKQPSVPNKYRLLHEQWVLKNITEIPNLPNYGYIYTNIYQNGDHKDCQDLSMLKCDCILSPTDIASGKLGCLSECTNRNLNVECNNNCACEELCANKQFSNFAYQTISISPTADKGFGIFITNQCMPGEFLFEIVGEYLPKSALHREVEHGELYNTNKQSFVFALENQNALNLSTKSNFARFLNHSCDPNSEIQKWCVDGSTRLGVFSKRPLQAGDEITIHYKDGNLSKLHEVCRCKSKNCTGYIVTYAADYLFKSSTVNTALLSSINRSGITNANDLMVLVRYLMISGTTDDSIKMKFINALNNTKSEPIRGKFVYLHGLKILNRWLNDFSSSSADLNMMILQLLPKLPITFKDQVEKSEILPTLENFASKNNHLMNKSMLTMDERKAKSFSIEIEQILNKWKNLSPKFVIPFYLPPENEMTNQFAPMNNNNMMPPNQMNMMNPNFPPHVNNPVPKFNNSSVMHNVSSQPHPNSFSSDFNSTLPGSHTSSINISNQQLASILSNITSLKSNQNAPALTEQNAAGNELSSNKGNDLDLPPNWKSAKTSFGKVYFYNTTTKQTQWEKPVIENLSPKKTPVSIATKVEKSKVVDEKKYSSKSASIFKKEASKVVISLLQLYLKGKMSYGRITNSEDFKYLARFFTHYILDKEVEKQGEDSVRFSPKIKDRISEYVSSYMKRQGPLFKRTL